VSPGPGTTAGHQRALGASLRLTAVLLSTWFVVSYGAGILFREQLGFVFVWQALAIGIGVALVSKPPPQDVQDLVDDIRIPGTRSAHGSADADMKPMPAD